MARYHLFWAYIQYQIVYNLHQRKRESYASSAKQLNFPSISNDFDKFYNQNQDNLLSLLDEFIPYSFYRKYHSHFGNKRDFSLESLLSAFIIKNILSISSIDLLITFFIYIF